MSKLEGNKCTHASSYRPIPLEAWLLSEVLRPHLNIVQMCGCDVMTFKSKNMYFEYCTGGDLIDQIDHFSRQRNYAPEVFILHAFVQVAQALAYIHHGLRWDPIENAYMKERGFVSLVHGDIKADSIFLDWTHKAAHPTLPRVVLGDFGMAQPTATFKSIAGTRTYEAPEIARIHDIKKTNPSEYNRLVESTGLMTTATDVNSFGIVMHILATLKTHKVAADPYDDGHMEGKARVGVKLPSLY